MSLNIHFETLTTGMKAKLDPGYRSIVSRESIDYAATRSLLQSKFNERLPFISTQKRNGVIHIRMDKASKS
jgi:uncharacterized protein YpmS